MRGYWVTAPSEAEDASLAYLASTPLVYFGFMLPGERDTRRLQMIRQFIKGPHSRGMLSRRPSSWSTLCWPQ